MPSKERKAEIARENSKKSTGPKTAAGKAASSRNALRHGKHAKPENKWLAINSSLLSIEDRQLYEAFVNALYEQFQPTNEAERLAVLRIAEGEMKLSRWGLIETVQLESEFDRVPASYGERFADTPTGAALYHAARNIQAHAQDSRLAEYSRRQQAFYHKVVDDRIRQFLRLRATFPGERPLPAPPEEIGVPIAQRHVGPYRRQDLEPVANEPANPTPGPETK
jgi:hypothetical protein